MGFSYLNYKPTINVDCPYLGVGDLEEIVLQ